MKTILRTALLLAALIVVGTPAMAAPCVESQSGSLMCNASCAYSWPYPECRVDMNIRWEDYCYFDFGVCACHNGSGDPCCDSDGI
jgi:hypothetical protein